MSHVKSKQSGFWAGVKEIAILLIIVFLIRTFGFGLYQVPTGSMETTMLVGERFFADKLTLLFSQIKRGDIISFNEPTFNYSTNTLKRLSQDYVWGPSNWTKRVIGLPGERVKGVIENGKPVVYIDGKKLDEPYINSFPLVHVSSYKINSVPDAHLDRYRGLLRQGVDLGIPGTTKSYDPSVDFESQPFYKMRQINVLRSASGEPLLLGPGVPLLGYGRRMSNVTGHEGEYWGGDEFEVTLGKNEYWVMGDNRLGSHDSRAWGPLNGRLIHGKILYRIWSVDSDESWWIFDLIKHPIDFFKRVRWSRFFQRVK